MQNDSSKRSCLINMYHKPAGIAFAEASAEQGRQAGPQRTQEKFRN
jgi:hypothetical protein